jgi:putative phosphoesterase
MARPFIGLISDTHGLVRPAALDALSGASRIVHAGDIGPPQVLQALRGLAPVVAVRGNMDFEGWCADLRLTEVVDHGSVRLYVLHDLGRLDLDPVAAGFAAVVTGHTHRPKVEREGEVLYLNPGSAGPQRSSLPASVMRLYVSDDGLTPELVELDVEPS